MEARRYEVKMICKEMLLPDVHAWVRMHPEAFIEAYPPRQVDNIYFDTHGIDALNDNLIGVSERTKLRYRWYGKDTTYVLGHLELKHKSNQVGWKEHCPIPVTFDLTSISWHEMMEQLQEQADDLFAIWLLCMGQPVLVNTYMREYYESIDHQLRLTIDHHLAAYEQVMHAVPNLSVRAPLPSQIVVEVKCDATLHRRVSNMLSSFPLPVRRNSKYVNSVLSALCFS